MFTLTSKPLLAIAISTAFILPMTASACGQDSYLGTICAFGFNFCPQGYLPADGRMLAIDQNTALFALLGTTYGGNGTTTFALPDLQGKSLVGVGQGPGLSPVSLGQTGGAEAASLLLQNMPPHTHNANTTVIVHSTVNVSSIAGNGSSPVNKVLANSTSRDNLYGDVQNATLASDAVDTIVDTAKTTIDSTGGGQPFGIRSPFLGITYCIATEGIYPSRD